MSKTTDHRSLRFNSVEEAKEAADDVQNIMDIDLLDLDQDSVSDTDRALLREKVRVILAKAVQFRVGLVLL